MSLNDLVCRFPWIRHLRPPCVPSGWTDYAPRGWADRLVPTQYCARQELTLILTAIRWTRLGTSAAVLPACSAIHEGRLGCRNLDGSIRPQQGVTPQLRQAIMEVARRIHQQTPKKNELRQAVLLDH